MYGTLQLAATILLLTSNVWIYRMQLSLRNSVFRPSKFVDFYSGGEYASHCTTIAPQAQADVDAFKYCEDIIFWDLLDGEGKRQDRRALIACDSGRGNWNTVMGPMNDPEPLGSLWAYSVTPKVETAGEKLKNKLRGTKTPSEPKPERIEIKNYPDGHHFHPLGAEIYPSYGGNSSYLFVVNHAGPRSYVEQFIISPLTPNVATHVRTISHDYIHSPNSLALTSPNSFYLSNDHLFTRRIEYGSKIVPVVETFLGLPSAWLSHFTLDEDVTSNTTVVAHSLESRLAFANGVSISPSGKEVAVSSTSLGRVYLFKRDPVTNSLKSKTNINVPFLPDNLQYSEDGTLIVAGHPNFVTLTRDRHNAPSWVVAITEAPIEHETAPISYDLAAPVSSSSKVVGPTTHNIETIYQGVSYPTSATGLYDSGTGELFVAGLWATGVLLCKP